MYGYVPIMYLRSTFVYFCVYEHVNNSVHEMVGISALIFYLTLYLHAFQKPDADQDDDKLEH